MTQRFCLALLFYLEILLLFIPPAVHPQLTAIDSPASESQFLSSSYHLSAGRRKARQIEDELHSSSPASLSSFYPSSTVSSLPTTTVTSAHSLNGGRENINDGDIFYLEHLGARRMYT